MTSIWLGASAGHAWASQSVELTWTPSVTPNVVAYKVYFGTQSHTYSDAIYFGNVTDVIIPGLASGATYYFAVTAIDDQNRESAFSAEVVYAVPASGTLTLNIQAATIALQAVNASWNSLTDSDIYGYMVKYGTQSGVYTNSATFYGTTEGLITGLAGAKTYYFRVFPIDSFGVQTNGSSQVSFTTPALIPIMLQANVPLGSSGVRLVWNAAPNPGVIGYVLHYGTASHSYDSALNCGSLNEYVLHGLVPGQKYYFSVSPVDSYGNEGQPSNETNCIAPAPYPLNAKVQYFTNALQAANISWTPSPDPDVNGYLVYYGSRSNVYDGTCYVSGVTNQILTLLAGNATNYFAVAPVDSFGAEPIATSRLPLYIPEAAPINVTAQAVPNTSTVHLEWNFVPNQGIIAYSVLFGTESGDYEYGAGYGNINSADIDGFVPGQTYYFTVLGLDGYGDQTKLSAEFVLTTPPPGAMFLQTQTIPDANGRPYALEINTPSIVSGPWEVDYSTDLKNWTVLTNGVGSGNGDGHDLDVYVPIDRTKSRLYFRAVSNN